MPVLAIINPQTLSPSLPISLSPALPLSLFTLQDNLNFLKYPGLEDFVNDVRLIARNAHEYNGALSEVGREATDMLAALQVRSE